MLALFKLYQKDLFFLNYLISPENRNFDRLTIYYDVGHPVVIDKSLLKLIGLVYTAQLLRLMFIRLFEVITRV